MKAMRLISAVSLAWLVLCLQSVQTASNAFHYFLYNNEAHDYIGNSVSVSGGAYSYGHMGYGLYNDGVIDVDDQTSADLAGFTLDKDRLGLLGAATDGATHVFWNREVVMVCDEAGVVANVTLAQLALGMGMTEGESETEVEVGSAPPVYWRYNESLGQEGVRGVAVGAGVLVVSAVVEGAMLATVWNVSLPNVSFEWGVAGGQGFGRVATDGRLVLLGDYERARVGVYTAEGEAVGNLTSDGVDAYNSTGSFGFAVAIVDEFIAVSAPHWTGTKDQEGRVLVFQYAYNGSFHAQQMCGKLGGVANAVMGYSLDMEGLVQLDGSYIAYLVAGMPGFAGEGRGRIWTIWDSGQCNNALDFIGWSEEGGDDIGYDIDYGLQKVFAGSPHSQNNNIPNTNSNSKLGRMYVINYCFPNYYIDTSSTRLYWECKLCGKGEYTEGGVDYFCDDCTKPTQSSYKYDYGCEYECNSGYFGSDCLVCSEYMETEEAENELILPDNAHWSDGGKNCTWECDDYFTISTNVYDVNATCLPPDAPNAPLQPILGNETQSTVDLKIIDSTQPNDSPPILSYYIYISDDGGNTIYRKKYTDMKINTVTSLIGATTYTFAVTASNIGGIESDLSNWSDSITTSTPTIPDVPGVPNAISINAGSLIFEWDIPEHGGDPISHYEVVLINCYDSLTPCDSLTYEEINSLYNNTNPDYEDFIVVRDIVYYNNATLGRLTHDTLYACTVAACNTYGCSDFTTLSSDTRTDSTDIPSAPLSLNVDKIAADRIKLNWEAPIDYGGTTLSAYEIIFTNTTIDSNNIENEVDDLLDSSDYKISSLISSSVYDDFSDSILYFKLENNNTLISSIYPSYMFNGFKGSTIYSCVIRAINSEGYGPWSNVLYNIETNDYAISSYPIDSPQVTDITSSTMTIQWYSPLYLGGDNIAIYEMYYVTSKTLDSLALNEENNNNNTYLGGRTFVGDKYVLYDNINNNIVPEWHEFQVRNLVQSNYYQFFVRAKTDHLDQYTVNGTLSEVYKTNDGQAPSKMDSPIFQTRQSSSPNSVNILITPPYDLGGDIIYQYTIYLSKDTLTNIIEQNFTSTYYGLNNKQETFTFQGLESDTRYYGSVSAWNSVGKSIRSDFSNDYIKTSMPTISSKPLNLRNITTSNSRVTLKWDYPNDNGNSNIDSFNVYDSYDNITFNYVDTIIVTSQKATYEYTVLNLEGNTDYYYSITAVNDVGESKKSKVLYIKTKQSSEPDQVNKPTILTTSNQSIIIQFNEVIEYGGEEILYYKVSAVKIYNDRRLNNDLSQYNISSNALNGLLDNLQSDQNYSISIQAINDIGISDPSDLIYVKTANYSVGNVQNIISSYVSSSIINLEFNINDINNINSVIFFVFDSDHYSSFDTIIDSESIYYIDTIQISELNKNGNKYNYNITDLTSSTSYQFAIQTMDNNGYSGSIIELTNSITTLNTSSPSSPILYSTSSSSNYINITSSTISISYNLPIDDGGQDIISYRGYLYKDSELISTVISEELFIEFTNLYGNTDYYMKISAYNGIYSGQNTSLIGPLQTLDFTQPQSISQLYHNDESVTSSSVKMLWEVPDNLGGVGNALLLNYTLFAFEKHNSKDADDYDLDNYNINVKSLDESISYDHSSYVRLSQIDPITNDTLYAHCSSDNLVYDMNEDILSCNITGMKADTCYYYRIISWNNDVESLQSDISGPVCTNVDSSPSDPVLSVVSLNPNNIKLSWSASVDDGGSMVKAYDLVLSSNGLLLDACDQNQLLSYNYTAENGFWRNINLFYDHNETESDVFLVPDISTVANDDDVDNLYVDLYNSIIPMKSGIGYKNYEHITIDSEDLAIDILTSNINVVPGSILRAKIKVTNENNYISWSNEMLIVVPVSTAAILPDPKVTESTSSSLNITLTPPDFTLYGNGGCISKSYQIYINLLNETSNELANDDNLISMNGNFNINDLDNPFNISFYLSDLDYATEYNLIWNVENDIGVSSWSNKSIIRTDAILPSKPLNLTLKTIFYGTANVSWHIPRSNGGSYIEYYDVYVWDMSDYECTTNFTSNYTYLELHDTKYNNESTIIMNSDGTNMLCYLSLPSDFNDLYTEIQQLVMSEDYIYNWINYTVDNLDPSTPYMFKIRSHNEIGDSGFSESTVLETVDSLPCLEDINGHECSNQGECHSWNGKCECYSPYTGNICDKLDGQILYFIIRDNVWTNSEERVFIDTLASLLSFSEDNIFVIDEQSNTYDDDDGNRRLLNEEDIFEDSKVYYNKELTYPIHNNKNRNLNEWTGQNVTVVFQYVDYEACNSTCINEAPTNNCIEQCGVSVSTAIDDLITLMEDGDETLRDLDIETLYVPSVGENVELTPTCDELTSCESCLTNKVACNWCDYSETCQDYNQNCTDGYQYELDKYLYSNNSIDENDLIELADATCPVPVSERCSNYSDCSSCFSDAACGWCAMTRPSYGDEPGCIPTYLDNQQCRAGFSSEYCIEYCEEYTYLGNRRGEISYGSREDDIYYLEHADCNWNIEPDKNARQSYDPYPYVSVKFSRIDLNSDDEIIVYESQFTDNSGYIMARITENNYESYLNKKIESDNGNIRIAFSSDSSQDTLGYGFDATWDSKPESLTIIYIILFVVLGTFALFGISCFCFYFISRIRYGDTDPWLIEMHERNQQSQGMNKEELAQIKTSIWKETEHEEDNDQCVICLVEYEDEDNVNTLPCDHIYHEECLKEWLKLNSTCPLCKRDVKKMLKGDMTTDTEKEKISSTGAGNLTNDDRWSDYTPEDAAAIRAILERQSSIEQQLDSSFFGVRWDDETEQKDEESKNDRKDSDSVSVSASDSDDDDDDEGNDDKEESKAQSKKPFGSWFSNLLKKDDSDNSDQEFDGAIIQGEAETFDL